MKIPVFVSSPTALNAQQHESREVLMQFLDELNLEPRALGRSDYPSELPLREVLVIARHCAGQRRCCCRTKPCSGRTAPRRSSPQSPAGQA
jgi:hypothetical protein